MFIKQVKEQLGKMSEAEKEEWILTQAKLLGESKQQSFLMSLSGEKKVIYMPSQGEIEEFCEKVDHGDIYLEYETHYYEFDDDGRYMDDWKVWHNDPFQAMGFLNRVFRGCHDLLPLNDYKTVVDILDVDDIGQIHVKWHNGSSLALVPEEDSFRKLPDQKQGNSQQMIL
jgi:hypothetical protein